MCWDYMARLSKLNAVDNLRGRSVITLTWKHMNKFFMVFVLWTISNKISYLHGKKICIFNSTIIRFVNRKRVRTAWTQMSCISYNTQISKMPLLEISTTLCAITSYMSHMCLSGLTIAGYLVCFFHRYSL